MSEIEEKLKGWLPIVDAKTWQIFRLLKKKPHYILELEKDGFLGSRTTILEYVNMLEECGFIESETIVDFRQKRMVQLTDKGEEALELIDKLGELVKEEKNEKT